MIKFNELPAIPGSLEPSSDLSRVIANGDPVALMKLAENLGGTIMVNVDPPTPARAVEVAYPLVDGEEVSTVARTIFMQGIIKGAIEVADRATA